MSAEIPVWKRYRLNHPERYTASMRRFHLKRKYGMTLEAYDALLQAQNGVCKICGEGPRKGYSLSVDHDHKTGRIRGLLCYRCNCKIIGILENRPDILHNLLHYLDVR